MNYAKRSMKLKKSVMCAALASVLGTSGMVSADTYTFSYTGVFTMLDPSGKALVNSSSTYLDPWVGKRTNITGTMTYDTVAQTGTATITPFDFFSGGPAVATSVSFGSAGGNLMLVNMGFNWNGNNGIPVSLVWDMTGMLAALPKNLGGSISGAGGTLPASDLVSANSVPLGLVPISTTTWNTTQIPAPCTGVNGATCMGINPSGALPLVVDPLNSPYGTGIGGNPMIAGPFMGYNANFDIRSMTVTVKNGVSGPASISATTPVNTATGVLNTATVSVSFNQPMDAATVANAFTLTGPGGTVAGTTSPNTGLTATSFIFTPSSTLSYNTVYTATVGAGARNAGGVALVAGAANPWTFTTAAQPVTSRENANCATAATAGSYKGTFTMLDPAGFRVGRDTAVTGTWDGTTNTASNGTTFNMTLQSPNPFYGVTWIAHDIRVFGPGSYTINTGCTVAELRAGTAAASCAVAGQNMSFTVAAGQLAAHILFDWNGNNNISVVNLWSREPVGACLGSEVPRLSADGTVIGYGLASLDVNGDGFAGLPMTATSPFPRFNANFDLYGDATGARPAGAITAAGPSGGGCAVNQYGNGDQVIPAILLAALGYLGLRRKQ
jgi:hypothetical protein